MSTVLRQRSGSGRRLVLQDVDWRTYGRLLRALDARPSLRMTYDRGVLEIMTLSPEHESLKYLIGRLIDAASEELQLEIAGGGSTTFRRRRAARGLEPDNCYWITNEAKVRGKKRIDLRTDPPPDLAVEVDITHDSLDRMPIYAALRVPEVWRYDGQTFTINILGSDGKYTASDRSRAFPQVTTAAVAGLLAQHGQQGTNALVAQFRTWLRQQRAAAQATGKKSKKKSN